MSERAAEIAGIVNVLRGMVRDAPVLFGVRKDEIACLEAAADLLSSLPPVRGEQETATTANGSMPIADLECPCCGDVGARADLEGFFHDGDRLICGCYGWVTADGDTLYISGTGDEPCPKCEPSAPVRAEAAKTDTPFGRLYGSMPDITDEDITASSPVREAEPKSDDASLRTVVAHPFFALAREFGWDDRQLTAARQLIDITVIRLEERQAAQQDDALQGPSASPAREAEPLKALVDSIEYWRRMLSEHRVQGFACDMLEDFDTLINGKGKG